MMEYEKLPPGLQQWCDQAASRAAEEERYQVRREVSLRAYQSYTELCADHDPKQAETLALHALGSPYEAVRQRERKNARTFLTAAVVAAAAVAVWDAVFVLLLWDNPSLSGISNAFGPGMTGLMTGMAAAHVAVIAALVFAVNYYRRVKRSSRPT